MYMQENDQQELLAMCYHLNWLYECHGESHSIIKTLHSFGKGKTLKVTKIARKLRCTQEPQYTPTCTGTTLSVSYLPFFSPNLGGGGGEMVYCVHCNKSKTQTAVSEIWRSSQGFQQEQLLWIINLAAIYMQYRL